MSTFYKAITV